MLAESDVTLTDYGLAIECAIFAVALRRRPPARPWLRRGFVIFYAAVGTASLLGGTVHGFFPDPESAGRRLLWPATLLAIGLAGLAIWGLAAGLQFAPRTARLAAGAAALVFLGYAAIVLFVSQGFWVAIVYYLPASAAFLAVLLARYARTSDRRLIPAMTGIVLGFAASAIQQLGIALHPLYFDHNALYHLVQAVALLLIFMSARWLSGLPEASTR